MTAQSAADHFLQFVGRPLEPACRRQQAEQVEEHGRRVAHTRKQRPPFAVAVAYPYGHHVVGRRPHGPRIAVAVARSCLPGYGTARMEGMPVALFLRTAHLGQHVEGTPDGSPRKRRETVFAIQLPCHRRISRRQVAELDLRAAQDEREPVGVGAARDGRETGALQQVDEFLYSVFVEHPH